MSCCIVLPLSCRISSAPMSSFPVAPRCWRIKTLPHRFRNTPSKVFTCFRVCFGLGFFVFGLKGTKNRVRCCNISAKKLQLCKKINAQEDDGIPYGIDLFVMTRTRSADGEFYRFAVRFPPSARCPCARVCVCCCLRYCTSADPMATFRTVSGPWPGDPLLDELLHASGK